MSSAVAVNVQNQSREILPLRPALPPQSMNKDFQIRFTAILLSLLTVAAVVYATYNFQVERLYQVPTDGAWWVEENGRLVAERVDPDGPALRADVKVGDQLTAVDEHKVSSVADLMRQLYRVVRGRRQNILWCAARFRWT